MGFPELEKQNIYVIPAGGYFKKGDESCYLVYSPLANVFFLALPPEVVNLENLLKEGSCNQVLERLLKNEYEVEGSAGETPDTFGTLHLLLNEKCNFHCKYCYSAGGRSSAELTMEQIEVMLEYFLSAERKTPGARTVMFMGGGEPVLSWKKLEQSVALAKEIAARNDVKVNFSLTTNGSILTDRMLEFLKAHNFTVQISFEVLPDVQNEQRAMYDEVAENLNRLTAAGVSNYVRSTITAANVDRIPEMVEHCRSHFPQVKKLSCQHVVDPEYFSSQDVVSDFFKRYFHSFNTAKQQAEKSGIELRSSSSHLINYSKREKFCYNIVCLTPYGTLTTCPDVSSPQEKDYTDSVFASIEDGKVVFDIRAFERLTKGSIHTIEKCKTCWARWNCGSGCPSSRRVYSDEIFDSICDFYRDMLGHSLMNELQLKYHTATGKDLIADISAKL